MSSQRDNSFLAGSRLLHLLLSLLSGLLGSAIFFAGVHYLAAYQTSHLRAPEWPISHARERLDIRNDLAARDLLSSIGDFFKGVLPSTDAGALPSTDTGALSGILTTIESSIKKLLGDVGGSLIDGLADPAKFLGIGLASGAMTGLNMTAPNLPEATGVSNLAENLGSGLSSTVFASDIIKSLTDTNPGPGGTLGGSNGTFGQAALALGQGLGSGASSGLRLATVAGPTGTYNTTGLSGIAGSFGEGLSSSLLSNIKLPSTDSLLDSLKGMLGGSNTTINVAEYGTAVGSGIGEGAAIGLGLQNKSGSYQDTGPGIAKGFVEGLVSSFLQNDTAGKLIASFDSTNSSLLTISSVDFAKVAEGLAVGLVSGVGSTISTLDLISANTSSYNDSVGGAATGFGRGLGSEGAKLVSEILDSNKVKLFASAQSAEQTKGISSRLKERRGHYKRATDTNATDLASVLSNLNASNINPLVQAGMDALSCQGVGGIVAIVFGLVQSKTINLGNINLKDLESSTPTIGNVSLPDQEFVIRSEGNTYRLNPAKGVGSISVNGLGIFPLVGVAAAHIVFAILAHFAAIPLFVLLFNYFKITNMLNRNISPTRAPPLPRWLIWLGYSIVPLTFITFGFGVAFRAGGKHFTTPHEILGLLVFLQTLFAAAMTQYLRQNPPLTDGNERSLFVKRVKIANIVNLGILFLLTQMTLVFSFSDLSALSLCISQTIIPTSIWAALGWILMGPLTLAIGLQALLIWLKWLEHKKKAAWKVHGFEKFEKGANIKKLERPRLLDLQNLSVGKIERVEKPEQIAEIKRIETMAEIEKPRPLDLRHLGA
ncbi:hypothetical protein VTL71DRAFT_13945 [Oculimacula yallundae]|uniref:Cytochrome b561 domain-containing protein n=1 Tax=Oculimacula yallundae TaxID=86028 RepID=A0ABR4CMC3_9HELO